MAPVFTSLAVTAPPAITDCEGSTTVPVIALEVPLCPNPDSVVPSRERTASTLAIGLNILDTWLIYNLAMANCFIIARLT
jgi:hypothetical protein